MPIAPILRLTQTASQANRHTITLEWLEKGTNQTASTTVESAMTEEDQRDIAWYVEEYAEYPFEPHRQRATEIEARLSTLGCELFNKLFKANQDTQRIWFEAARRLDNVRVEIVTNAEHATTLPWELLRDPETKRVLALHAQAFVRAAPNVARTPLVLKQAAVMRILLVICRPVDDGDYAPFRSVASRLLKSLSAEAREVFQLEVLRPPTFARLTRVLRDAKAANKPYHVVHFDGHGVFDGRGVYALSNTLPEDMSKFTDRGAGPQGFLLFESDTTTNRREFVDGSRLGKLLVQNNVSLLVLNACRAIPDAPAAADHTQREANAPAPAVTEANPNAKVCAFGSLAQQVLLTGVGGVVALRYNVHVVTAAQFVAKVYQALVQGMALGEAVSQGRKDLHTQPEREIVQKVKLQDWLVPVVYETQAMRMFQPSPAAKALAITIEQANATPQCGELDPELPQTPETGFFGRDETLLALERGFDRHHVVLLHALVGSGKTTTAAEFARWYALTGGVHGPVLWSNFEQHTSLMQVLDRLGLRFNQDLQQSGHDWRTITDPAQKRDLALQILRQVPVLWVWDNVESVAGFPRNEQQALADFLRAAKDSQAKFLLTSRRDEQAWLGELPVRVVLPPMPIHERNQLAKQLAAKYEAPLRQDDWTPLLMYGDGNPLTLTVTLGRALRELEAGEAISKDNANEGQSIRFGTSLRDSFATKFNEQESAMLALLHHFQGFVDVDALHLMGNTDNGWHVPAIAGLTREKGVALLDRAAATFGLLTAQGDGYYSIHRELSWFLRSIYEKNLQTGADRAYVEAMGALGDYYHHQYEGGNRDMIAQLHAEEANLLHARRLALQHEWYGGAIIGVMQGLRSLYAHTGRHTEWRALVDKIVPVFVDPTSDGPLHGRDAEWALVTEYRVLLLKEERQWAAAAKLQGLRVNYDRQQAAPLLVWFRALPLEELEKLEKLEKPEKLKKLKELKELKKLEELDGEQRNTLRSLAVSVEQLGHLQREQGVAACVDSYQESYDLALRMTIVSLAPLAGEYAVAASCAFNLGRCYAETPALRDLAQAEAWYRRNLEVTPESDQASRGKTLGQLGLVTYERFMEARQTGQPEAVLQAHLRNTLWAYQEVLHTFPLDPKNPKEIPHN